MKRGSTSRNRRTDSSRASWPPPHNRCVCRNLIHAHTHTAAINLVCFFLSSRWSTGFVWRCRTTWILWGTLRLKPSWRTSGQPRTWSKMPGTQKQWGSQSSEHKRTRSPPPPFLNLCICLHPFLATAQPLSLRLGCQGGAEQLVSGAHTGETGVHGRRGDSGHGPAAAGREGTGTDVIMVTPNPLIKRSW